MKRNCLLLALLLAAPPVGAIPNVFFGNGAGIPIIPAFPRFRADLTEDFLDEGNWQAQEFPGPWRDEPALEGETARRMEAVPMAFGEVPMSVAAFGDSGGVRELVISFLDAGLYFGYHYGGEQSREEREAGRARRQEFSQLHKGLSRRLSDRLGKGCGRGVAGSIGRTSVLRSEFVEYRWEGFVLRLVARPDHSVALHIYRAGSEPRSFVDEEFAEMGRRDRAAKFAAAVERSGDGELVIRGLPMCTQGETPFCGVHSLAMASRYLGLTASPNDLAGSAGFKNTGSAAGSKLVDLYRAVGSELGMRVSVAPSFDRSRVLRSLEAGVPVVVWRRVSLEREIAHRRLAEARKEDPSLAPPALSAAEIGALPPKGARGTPSHASVLTGFSPETDTLVYAEPWGEDTRDRRMRIEEMEATAYAAFFFKL